MPDEESTDAEASEADGGTEGGVEGAHDGEECQESGDEVSSSDGGESACPEDKYVGKEAKVEGGETGNDSDQETWTLGADEHLEETATESDSEQSVEHVDLCTPEKKPDMLWREELFTTPIYGNSGPRREEITEMCIGLLQYFGQNEPEIAKLLSLCLSRSILFSKTINRSKQYFNQLILPSWTCCFFNFGQSS